MKFFKKYILLLFLIENLLAQTFIANLPTWVFYSMTIIGGLLLFSKEVWSKTSVRECLPLYLLSIIYILYQFTVGVDTLSTRSMLYLAAKVTTFAIIVVSVTSNWRFYAQTLPIYFSFVIVIVLLFGMGRGVDLESGERMTLGFGNSNSTSSLSAICLAGVLFFWKRKYALIYISIAAISLFALLAGGGRNAILILAIMLIVWTRLSVKRVIPAIIVGIVAIAALNFLPVNLAGVNRVKDTIEGNLGASREDEREAAKIMIAEKPLTGWGFEARNVGRAESISEMGAHSGYLDTIKFMGYPFAIVWFAILLFSVLPLLKYIRREEPLLRYHLAIVVSHIAAAFFESLYVGVHEFSTNIIFYSLAVLTTYHYREKLNLMQSL